MNTNDTNLQDNPLADQENEKLSDENAQIPEIYVGLSFETWDQVKRWFDAFGLQQGFSYKTRRSESDNGIIRRLTYECSKSDKYVVQVTVDPTKRRNTSSQKTEY